tara:strand:- start:267 stop:584 length:318 start_codon:yes stop_codon:yes gene_type:complete
MIKKDTMLEMNIVYGGIYVKLFVKKTLTTFNNFYRFLDKYLYKDFHFFRIITMSNQPISIIKIKVIQGVIGFEKYPLKLPPIHNEPTNATEIKHMNGTISMARIE